MPCRVRIFLWDGDAGSRYMGEHDLAEQPTVGGTVQFGELGRSYSAQVMSIAPASWDPTSALIPAVHVAARQPASVAATAASLPRAGVPRPVRG